MAMGFTSFFRSLLLLVLAIVTCSLIFKLFFILNEEIESRPHHQVTHHNFRTAKQLFKNDFTDDVHNNRHDVQYPSPKDVCSGIDDSYEKKTCLPVHRCFRDGVVSSYPKICGWSSLLPDVCCQVPELSENEPSVTAASNENSNNFEHVKATTGNSPEPFSSTLRPVEGTTAGVPTTAHSAVPQTMTGKTSSTMESISFPMAVPSEPQTVIKWTDVTASTTERPFTALTSIAGSDKRSTAFPLTSTAASLAWSTRGPVLESGSSIGAAAVMPTKSVSGELMKKTTPMPVIAYKNSLNCGLSDEKTVWPFVAAIHEAKGLDEAVFLCSAVILSRRYIGVSESCLKNSRVDFTSDRVHDLRISTNDRRAERSKQHLVADISLFPATTIPGTTGGHRLDHNNESISSGLALLRVAPKISFSSIVKPVCLPLPDEESVVNDAAATSTKDLLFASHAAVRDQEEEDADGTVTESSVTSLILTSPIRDHRIGADLIRVTDQRLEIPQSTCTQILRQSGVEPGILPLLRDQTVMCALNSPLFTLNCRHTPGGLVLQKQRGRWIIRGIEVLQTRCGHFMSPGLYIDFRNDLLLHWITERIASN